MKLKLPTEKLSNLLGLYLLAALAAAALLGFSVIKPAINKGQQTGAEISKVQSEIAALKQLQKDTEELRSNYETVREERDRILAQLPTKSEEERLLALLSNLAAQSGVVLSTFTPEQSAATGIESAALSLFPVSINVSGTYLQIQILLEKIENGARFIDLQNASFTGSSQGLEARFGILAYYQGAAAEAPEQGQP